MSRLIALLTATGLLASTSANAVQISFESRNDATFGTTSAFQSGGDFVQFDDLGGNGVSSAAACRITATAISDSNNGDFSSSQIPATDQRGYSLAPSGSTGCYYNVGTNGSDQQVTGVSDFFVVSNVDSSIIQSTYFGFLWGSPDNYNTLQFVGQPDTSAQGASVVATTNNFDGLDTNRDGILTALEIYQRIAPGTTTLTGDNAQSFYVNFLFDPSETVFGLRLGSDGNCCFEIDNLASDGGTPTAPTVTSPLSRTAQLATVPEPASVALFGLATLAFAVRRRRQGDTSMREAVSRK